MPTKYDVFAAIIEHAPCKAKDLPFNVRIYSHLKKLKEEKIIKESNGKLVPIANKETKYLFSVIKYSLKNGLDYNILLSKNMPLVIKELFVSVPNLRPKRLSGNKDNTFLMHYLEKHQFILLTKNKPKKGIILNHQLFNNILALNNISVKIRTSKFSNVKDNVLRIKSDPLNPFDDKVFAFLSGSAQLEGSTVTIGETKELIIQDIYPDKPKKDIQMVKNLNEAMHYVLDNIEKDITVDSIKQLNKLVLFSLHRNAGKFKKTENKIQGNPNFKTAQPSLVPSLMDKYCLKINEVTDRNKIIDIIGYSHNELQRIHPFSDGNSRTTRMVLNWILLKNHFPLLILKMGCFDEYMVLTKLSKIRDDKRLTNLFHHLLLHESLVKN
jgi:hypothetical protein